MTPYRRYLVDGILLLEPTEAKVVKKYTLIDWDLFRHGYTHPTLIWQNFTKGYARVTSMTELSHRRSFVQEITDQP